MTDEQKKLGCNSLYWNFYYTKGLVGWGFKFASLALLSIGTARFMCMDMDTVQPSPRTSVYSIPHQFGGFELLDTQTYFLPFFCPSVHFLLHCLARLLSHTPCSCCKKISIIFPNPTSNFLSSFLTKLSNSYFRLDPILPFQRLKISS